VPADRLVRPPQVTSLDQLQRLVVDQPFSVSNPEVIGQLQSLESLAFGNGHLGSDRTLNVTDLAWIVRLPNLRTLHLPGTRLPAEQLATLAALPNLVELGIPFRRAYRKTVFDLALGNKAFAVSRGSMKDLRRSGRLGGNHPAEPSQSDIRVLERAGRNHRRSLRR